MELRVSCINPSKWSWERRLGFAKSLPELMLTFCQLDPSEHTSVKFDTNFFIDENAFEKVVCETSAILSWGRWVNYHERPQGPGIPVDGSLTRGALLFLLRRVTICIHRAISWWRHEMETFSALLAICAGNSPVTGASPHKSQWCGALMFSLIWIWING